MAESSDRVFHILYSECGHLQGRGEASPDDCLEACLRLAGHLVAVASFERGDTPEQYQHHIARTQEMIEAAIRVSTLALRGTTAEPDV